MTQAQIRTRFVEEFCKTENLHRSSLEDFAAAERELGSAFPPSYVSFLTDFGFGATPFVAALAREAEVWPMAHLLSPLEAVAASRTAWQAGMPRHLVAIATGADNDLLCFHRAQPGKRRADEALWAFHPHGSGAVRAFSSFDELLQECCEAPYERDDLDE